MIELVDVNDIMVSASKATDVSTVAVKKKTRRSGKKTKAGEESTTGDVQEATAEN